jgi:hypothetical protein
MLASAPSNGPLSKFAFCDLVLASTLELEKVRTGRPAKSEPLQHLADALSRAASPVSEGAPTAFVEAGYFVPLERLFTTFKNEQPKSIRQIQDFVQDATKDMRSLDTSGTSNTAIPKLINFCVALHEELVRGLNAENTVVSNESRSSNKSAATFVS